jgi:succinate-acetate transporter protein
MAAINTTDATPAQSSGLGIADPGPLGLAAFAMTTFVLSFTNTGIFKAEPVVFGLALAYGGVAQVLAGMWEFKKGNTFGATAFTSYGAFWISFWYLTGHTDLGGVTNANDLSHGIGLYLLGWFIFTAYMFVASLGTNVKLIAVFGLLTVTFALLALADLTTTDGLTKAGGWFGLATAVAAWFTSFSGVAASTRE